MSARVILVKMGEHAWIQVECLFVNALLDLLEKPVLEVGITAGDTVPYP